MAKDYVNAQDTAVAGLASAAAPAFPCPRCGRETKRHSGPREAVQKRICSSDDCRHVIVVGTPPN